MKYLLILVLIAYSTNALSSVEQEINASDVSVPEPDPDVQESTMVEGKPASETVSVEVRRRENCTYIYKPVYPVFCHPMAPRDEEGKCRKIVSLQIQCGPVEKKEGKSDCIPSPDNSEECFEEEGPVEGENEV